MRPTRGSPVDPIVRSPRTWWPGPPVSLFHESSLPFFPLLWRQHLLDLRIHLVHVSLDPGLHLAPDGLELITVPLDDCFNLIGLVFTGAALLVATHAVAVAFPLACPFVAMALLVLAGNLAMATPMSGSMVAALFIGAALMTIPAPRLAWRREV